jgi:hypothetical protein
MTDTTDIEGEDRRATGRSSPLAEILGVGIAIVVMGGLLCFDDTEASVATRSAMMTPPPAATIDASGYEALRDALAADSALVPMVREALDDGRIDVVEMDRIAPYAVRAHTAMDVEDARADMITTLDAKEHRR